MPDVGTLQVSLVSNRGKRPITDAAVEISSAGEPDKILEVLKTDLSGQTEVIELETPPLEYSMEPGLAGSSFLGEQSCRRRSGAVFWLGNCQM